MPPASGSGSCAAAALSRRKWHTETVYTITI